MATWAAIQATLNHFIKLLKWKDLLTPPAVMPEVEAIEIIEPWTLKKNSDKLEEAMLAAIGHLLP